MNGYVLSLDASNFLEFKQKTTILTDEDTLHVHRWPADRRDACRVVNLIFQLFHQVLRNCRWVRLAEK